MQTRTKINVGCKCKYGQNVGRKSKYLIDKACLQVWQKTFRELQSILCFFNILKELFIYINTDTYYVSKFHQKSITNLPTIIYEFSFLFNNQFLTIICFKFYSKRLNSFNYYFILTTYQSVLETHASDEKIRLL